MGVAIRTFPEALILILIIAYFKMKTNGTESSRRINEESMLKHGDSVHNKKINTKSPLRVRFAGSVNPRRLLCGLFLFD